MSGTVDRSRSQASKTGLEGPAGQEAGDYRAPWWLPGGNLQTIYAAALTHNGPRPIYARRRWNTPDGDFVDVDWIDGPPGSPFIMIFHGLEGGSGSHYARTLASQIAFLGWRGAVAHFRGCSGEPNRLPRAYHSGDSEEIGWMVGQFRRHVTDAPLAAVGVSLGGNAMLKWLGEAGDSAARQIACAVAVSAPLDLPMAGDCLGRGFNLLYARAFLRTLKEKSAEKARRFPGALDATAAKRARTLREFDDVVTAPCMDFVTPIITGAAPAQSPGCSRSAFPHCCSMRAMTRFYPASAYPPPMKFPPSSNATFRPPADMSVL